MAFIKYFVEQQFFLSAKFFRQEPAVQIETDLRILGSETQQPFTSTQLIMPLERSGHRAHSTHTNKNLLLMFTSNADNIRIMNYFVCRSAAFSSMNCGKSIEKRSKIKLTKM